MENPRPEKVAVVDEVRERLRTAPTPCCSPSTAASRSRSWPSCAARCGRPVATTRSTRTRWCASPPASSTSTSTTMLTGPTALAFVRPATDRRPRRGRQGPPRLRQDQPAPGGEGRRARRQGARAPPTRRPWPTSLPREELLARLAGLMAAPMQQFAGLLQAVPADFAYVLAGPHRPAWRPRRSAVDGGDRAPRPRSPTMPRPTRWRPRRLRRHCRGRGPRGRRHRRRRAPADAEAATDDAHPADDAATTTDDTQES